MNFDHPRLPGLVQRAASDPTLWEAALNEMDLFIGGSGLALITVTGRLRFTPASTNVAELMDDYFRGGWYANDRREACLPILRSNGIVRDQDFQTADEIEHCAYYSDLLARHRRKWFAGVGADVDGDEWCLALQRSPEKGPFLDDELQKLHYLRQLLQNGAALAVVLSRAWKNGLIHALETSENASALFDSKAKMLYANRHALRLLRLELSRDGHLLQGRSSLMRLLHETILMRGSHHVGMISFDGYDTYKCRASSLTGEECFLAGDAAVLLTMVPAGRDIHKLLRIKYQLTAAETNVAVAIADMKSVAEVAAINDVKADTVRSHLKAIFAKTGISGQAKLVALIHGLERSSFE